MTLIYQAYGLSEVIHQTLFSITSLLSKVQQSGKIKVVVYTDQPKVLESFLQGHRDILIETITSEQIKGWRGAINFVHRVKIEILMDAGQKYPGPLFYADGDTYFISSPERLFSLIDDSNSLMHIAESALDKGRDPISKKMSRFVKKNHFKVDGHLLKMSPQTVMWNAGVIGLSEKNKALLGKILQLTDEMHALYPKHVTEQLSVSYYLQASTTILSADKIIYHYWNQKPEYQSAIDKFLSRNGNINKAMGEISSFAYPSPPKAKEKLIQRLLNKLKS